MHSLSYVLSAIWVKITCRTNIYNPTWNFEKTKQNKQTNKKPATLVTTTQNQPDIIAGLCCGVRDLSKVFIWLNLLEYTLGFWGQFISWKLGGRECPLNHITGTCFAWHNPCALSVQNLFVLPSCVAVYMHACNSVIHVKEQKWNEHALTLFIMSGDFGR